MNEEWDDLPESEGITRGPEEALEREIARSKALKVERLQLRDRVDTLQKKVERLSAENERLRQEKTAPMPKAASGGASEPHPSAPPTPPMLPRSWAWALLLFNLAALGALLALLPQR
ncbi:hypothetical protein [Nitrospina watsonii]|uniref:Uncharacterized protein n=1 Tax=Nitrospina watsonii TaxID=1323948 RepID=A0ABM9HC86_9BACT|nr:hypothetical protein [Nitrospina watsonii]CAI2717774.1 conserved protein of unknown function [Nitrospina watsonii]